ncbi:NUDIX domain-containing protein [Bacillus sp. NTK074B]|uniref:NUDIX hydrolase n=1 Tax=Bacillus sp. NTK074B TaxID=2802174 RepID=UPI001A8FF704|nr:NUDIX domain-containing protein [Bacillus sp. NTK074B]
MSIHFYDLGTINETELSFAVISAIYKGKWVYVKHKGRTSWEIPGGQKEAGESIEEAAGRELYEETGCREADLIPICDYSTDGSHTYGRLFFGRIQEVGPLPDSEIHEVELFEELPTSLTYSDIQPKLFEKTFDFIRDLELG